MYQYLLFDLDGTLTDPYEGITKSFQYALHAFGIEEDLKNLNPVIGPPLIDSFMNFYGFSKEEAELGVAKYRERFAVTGIHENTIYPGIPELLEGLKNHGYTLCLATSKPEIFAKQILENFDIAKCFSVVVGAELDGTRNYKKDVITEVLKQLGNPPLDKVLMIGDRRQDVDGAKACNIASMGVRFGYAEPGELEDAGADYFADTVEELKCFLLG